MQSENLWGDIPKTGNLRTPITILREQASLLSQATNNVLEGDVSVGREASDFSFTLYIVAPALKYYRYGILKVTHEMTLYPLWVNSLVDDQTFTCGDEKQFKEVLTDILSSPHTHQVIDSLLSQSQAA